MRANSNSSSYLLDPWRRHNTSATVSLCAFCGSRLIWLCLLDCWSRQNMSTTVVSVCLLRPLGNFHSRSLFHTGVSRVYSSRPRVCAEACRWIKNLTKKRGSSRPTTPVGCVPTCVRVGRRAILFFTAATCLFLLWLSCNFGLRGLFHSGIFPCVTQQ